MRFDMLELLQCIGTVGYHTDAKKSYYESDAIATTHTLATYMNDALDTDWTVRKL